MSGPSASDVGAAADVSGTVFDDEQPEVTRSYATALLAAAEDAGQAAEVLDELDELVADVIRGHPAFAALLASSGLSTAEKDRILVRTFEKPTLPVLYHFLRVLNRHGRLALISPVARAARAIWDRKQNRRPVLIRSAVPLNETERTSLGKRMGAMLAATPLLSFEVDPALIGGLVVQVGDDVYDASIRRRLQLLRHRLIEGNKYEIQSRRDQFSHS